MGLVDRIFWEGHANALGFDLHTGAEAFYRLEGRCLRSDCVAFGLDFDNFSRFRGSAEAVQRGDLLASAFVRTRQAIGWRVLRRSPRGDEFLVLAPFPISALEKNPRQTFRALLEPAIISDGMPFERLGFTAGAMALVRQDWPIPQVRRAFELCDWLKKTGRRNSIAWWQSGSLHIYNSTRGEVNVI